MKKYIKKVYLSIMLVFFSILTMVATTYAWVGLLTNSTFNEFTINLREYDDPDAADYGIQLSLTGENGSFRDKIDELELRKQILTNLGYDLTNYSDNVINKIFSEFKMDQCTVTGNNYALDTFYDMNHNETKNYFWFDLYISVYKIYKNGESPDDYDSSNRISIYLRDHILSSNNAMDEKNGIYDFVLANNVTYPSVSGSFKGNPILGNSNITNSILPNSTVKKDTVYRNNVANACRVALEKFKSVPKGEPERYKTESNIYRGLTIYQSGSMYPTYDPVENIYDFGGILPKEYNFARLYYNSIHADSTGLSNIDRKFSDAEFEKILNRGDIVYSDSPDSESNHIVTIDDEVTTQRMIRFRVYFWFEGWDSDCFDVLDKKTVEMSLYLSTKGPKVDD